MPDDIPPITPAESHTLDAEPEKNPNTVSLDHESATKQELGGDLRTTVRFLIWAFLLGWVAIIVRFACSAYGKGGNGALQFGQMCVPFLGSLAFLASGFLFGFIFGVPKVISQGTSNNSVNSGGPNITSSLNRLKVNTNLEDISDWLTKVLVGATLTQIAKVPSLIKSLSMFMALGDSSPGSSQLMMTIIIYYSAFGFLSGYLLTRMFFARAFARSA